MTNSKHVPKRRFKEFESDGEWEFSRFGEVVVRVSESMMNSSFPNVEYEDVIPGKGQLNKNIHGKTNNKKGIRFLEGDVLYGKLRPYLKNWLLSDFKGIAVGDWWVLRSSELDSKFLYNFIQTEKYQVVANRSTGTKMPRSDWETVKDSDILFPSNFEQKKLGDFFQTIDSLISLHQHKLDKLKNLKKAYLSEMFPAEGERVPKRRFPGFEGEWEEKKLFELADVEGGGTPSTVNPQFWDGDIDWYTPAEIDERVFVDRSKRKITNLGLAKSSAKMLPIGTVLFTSRAGIGKTAILAREGCTNQGFQSIIPKEGLLDSYFIYSLSNKLKSYGERIGAGSTFVEVSGKQMSEMSLIIPSIFEQKQIGNFFNKLDQSISLQQQKLDKLKDLKKAYLNELFV
ncbi:restriction endonuclease subunit S [Streptococcus thermophilus]|uniref:restriction endonuclease subunit S n=1 Tax=Streptococcus thermophilus TaxID=1308 RepID=UPI001880FE46|nr:restriction endonuclease subunit S [Streptococcus thermophilus]QOH30107.1 restriction endonuclease subunit S [Streptococcus thermophilus]